MFKKIKLLLNSKNNVEKNDSEDLYTFKNFVETLEKSNFTFEIYGAEKNYLDGKSRLIIFEDDISLTIWEYESNELMELSAKTINRKGHKITNNNEEIKLNWDDSTHFFKRGCIIVNYCGKNIHTLEYLLSILNRPFAGDLS